MVSAQPSVRLARMAATSRLRIASANLIANNHTGAIGPSARVRGHFKIPEPAAWRCAMVIYRAGHGHAELKQGRQPTNRPFLVWIKFVPPHLPHRHEPSRQAQRELLPRHRPLSAAGVCRCQRPRLRSPCHPPRQTPP